jgi:hypothetical protein
MDCPICVHSCGIGAGGILPNQGKIRCAAVDVDGILACHGCLLGRVASTGLSLLGNPCTAADLRPLRTLQGGSGVSATVSIALPLRTDSLEDRRDSLDCLPYTAWMSDYGTSLERLNDFV